MFCKPALFMLLTVKVKEVIFWHNTGLHIGLESN